MHLEQKNPSRLKRQKKVGNSIMPPKRKLRILISNDDGIGSQGIMALGRALSRIAQVTMVAPEREQSTMGHALTLHKPVRIFHVGSEKNLDMWATSGTPADCVYVGLRYVMKHKPDIIVSGINRGVNLGNDAYYSGTIAAAREGAVMDIPAIAASLDYHYEPGKKGSYSFDWAADYIVELVKNLVENPIPPSCLLNINFPNVPAGKVKGVRVARQGFRIYTDKVEARHDFRGKKYFWLGGKYAGFKQIEGSDCEVLDQNFISITPFRIDLTQYDYNALGYKSVEVDPLGNTIKYHYDNAGNLVKYVGENNLSVSFEYDVLGRMTKEIDQNGNITSYEYDANGNVLKISDRNDHSDSFSYDGLGRLIKKTDANGNVESYEYSPNGNLVEFKNKLGDKQKLSYDKLGNVLKLENENGNEKA